MAGLCSSSQYSLLLIYVLGIISSLNIFDEKWLYYCLQFVEKEQENVDEDLDYRALEDGFVSCNFFVYHIFQSLLTSCP